MIIEISSKTIRTYKAVRLQEELISMRQLKVQHPDDAVKQKSSESLLVEKGTTVKPKPQITAEQIQRSEFGETPEVRGNI